MPCLPENLDKRGYIMSEIRFFSGERIPLELHKVRVVQKLNLVPVERRVEAMREAGCNTFLLKNKDIYLDMLTDSGVNAMSDRQMAAMMVADDSYAGSATFTRLTDKLTELFGTEYFLPAHQGRAAENIIAMTYVKPGSIIPMNYHFTTTKAHITRLGGTVEELVSDEGVRIESSDPFKGNFDLERLEDLLKREHGRIPFMRIEAGTNLIGGQPLSLSNIEEASDIAHRYGVLTVLDASLLQDNLYFIKTREDAAKDLSLREITRRIADKMDIIYFSGRKLGFARGGGISIHDKEIYLKMRELVPMFEGFLTYGGMSVREMEAMAVGLEETMDMDVISQGPLFIECAGRAWVPPRCNALHPSCQAGGIPCGLACGCRIHRWRHQGHGERHDLGAEGGRRIGASCSGGASAPGSAAPRLHALAGEVRRGQDRLALWQQGPHRRTEVHRRALIAEILLRTPRAGIPMDGEDREGLLGGRALRLGES